jgi:hypothetical protein
MGHGTSQRRSRPSEAFYPVLVEHHHFQGSDGGDQPQQIFHHLVLRLEKLGLSDKQKLEMPTEKNQGYGVHGGRVMVLS